ncbi:unnamed protein product [Clavelina lepadiformis]|uniref:Peptidase M14 domain-containing protein n=1 Tax=Clavelina lepadiformis TaxID=159417 RepID=A0ABP0GGT5_CLALP
MKLLVALIFSSILVVVCSKVSYRGAQVLTLNPGNENERDIVRELQVKYKLRFWRDPRRHNGPVDLQVPSDELLTVKQLLVLNRMSFEVAIDDLQESILAQVSPREAQFTLADFDYNKYHTFAEITAWTANFAKAHSKYVTRIKVGTTYENRTFYALKISTGGSGKKAFALDCGIHADEWIGPATCIHVIKNLTESIGTSGLVGDLLKDVDFYLIPSSNPDGYVYSWQSDRMWRKTRSPTSGNCFGVDPNRNWDSNFAGNGSSNDPCSDDYHGPHAWSEANVRAQRDFVNGIENLQGYIDIHSFSQLWMFPYGYTYKHARDYELLSKIASESVAAIKSVHGVVYTPGPIAEVIYVASGSTADYFYDHLKLRCVFAAELRDKGQHGMLLPESEIQPTAEEIFAGLLVIARNIREGNCAL